MTRPRVKICGLTRPADADLAVALGADAIGFVLWEGSPRAIRAADAAAIARVLPPFIARVGVFVNAPPAEVARAVRDIGLDVAQLHGDEAIEPYRGLAARLIKATALETDDHVRRACELPPDVTVLVDAADREQRGGTGQAADWSRAAELARARPILLAGGLHAENVAEAIVQVRPWAIDISSGVETSPGIKSAARLAEFFRILNSEFSILNFRRGDVGADDD